MGRSASFRFLLFTGAMLSLAGAFTPARAQDADDLKRGVARISLINGDISVRRGDSGEWVAGVINAPLMTGDHIGTGPNSRAEVQFDASNVLRLGANAEMRLSQLEYGRYQMELSRGVMTYRMLRTGEGNIEIDTPNLSVRPSRQGSFRISVNENGETEVTARNGDVEVFTPHGSQSVRDGQTLMTRGAASDAEFQIVAAGGMDDWDRWCDSRDRTIMQSTSSRYVGPGVYGAEDLDNYGNWTPAPEYGYVWRPAVGPDWAPYQAGRWAWEDWYGWTWVSYDPWGWAPYHYGRWFHDRWGWGWYPGLITARHYWSPALVGFFGYGGGGFGIGFGYGNVGWCALAPYEVFHPWWGRGYGGGYNRNINITHVNVTNVYRNANVRNGITGVGANDFQSGRFNNMMRTTGAQVGTAGVIHGQMPFTASSANQRFSDRQAAVIPRSNNNTRMFTAQQPNPVQRGGFGQGGASSGMSQNNRPAQAGQGEQSGGWRRFGSPSAPAAGQGSQPAVSRNGSGAAPATRNDRPSSTSGSQSGWQRFGAPGTGGNSPNQGRSPAAPQTYNQGQRYAASGGSGSQGSLRISPPVVRQRQGSGAPSYSAPSYSAPRQSSPSYSAPRQSAPSYSAPRQSAPSGGGGGSHGNSGGGGHGRR